MHLNFIIQILIYSLQMGFSCGDFTADALGFAYPVFQNKIHVLKILFLKSVFIRQIDLTWMEQSNF